MSYCRCAPNGPLHYKISYLGHHNSDVSAKDSVRTTCPSAIKSSNPTIEFARCFLRFANLPNFALDRLSRYEATLWRQVGRILFALDALDRRKPQERGRCSRFGERSEIPETYV